MQPENQNISERPPVVAVMGHIDHGKSTLLSYIRKSTAPLNETGIRHAEASCDLAEAGGITQHISAYEVERPAPEIALPSGSESQDIGQNQSNIGTGTRKITFLDTPGHEAFVGIRKRGASVADIAVLVVSAEDGVKPQTLEALGSIKASGIPYVVAINKIDKPEANIERTKQSLAENEIYIEGYGGDVPTVEVSAKTGTGIPELLDMIQLMADLQILTGDVNLPGEGAVIESNRDMRKGISATCIIKNGTIRKGMFVAAGKATSPVRILENFRGKPLESASFSSPVRIIGWDILPEVGIPFKEYATRDEAREAAEKYKEKRDSSKQQAASSKEKIEGEVAESAITFVPLIVKADTGSSMEAVLSEIDKLKAEQVEPLVISSGIGAISENDIRLANGNQKAIIIGFNVSIDAPAKSLATRDEIRVEIFDIIYKMSEWLSGVLLRHTPKVKTEEVTGRAKILKTFSRAKDKQIVGARVETGEIKVGAHVRILRRDAEIGQGKVRELQAQKMKASEVSEGKEFGTMIEAKVEIAPGDHIESYVTVEK